MSQQRHRPYEFADGVPLAGIPPGTNLLVAGPAMSEARTLALSLVLAGAARREGSVVVSTNKDADKLLDGYERRAGALDRSWVSVIDCTGRGSAGSRGGGLAVSSPGDLTGIGMQFSNALESLRAGDVRRVRAGVDSLSTLSMYTDARTLFRFLHVLTGRVSEMDGLGVYLLDAAAADERVVSTLGQLCDGRIDVREAGGDGELRTRGLADQPREWTPFTIGE